MSSIAPARVHRASRMLAAVGILLVACSADRATATITPFAPTTPSLAIVPGVCDYDRNESALAAAGWKSAFAEDFNGTLAKWSTWTGGAYNNELQHYQGANLRVGGGLLTVSAKKETVTGKTLPSDPTPKTFNWTSGRIESVQHFSAGAKGTPTVRMAARIKLPPGYGLWPAFWSYGDPWPTQGEIDIFEARGQNPNEYSTAYWYGRRAGINQVPESGFMVQTGTSLMSCFHVYELIWAKDQLTFLFDGQVVDTKTGGFIPSMYRKQQRVTVNLAVGGNFFGPAFDPVLVQPGDMLVDWVRVHTK